MNMRIQTITLLAALAVPAAAQINLSLQPYNVAIDRLDGSAPLQWPDVVSVHGLQVAKLLSLPPFPGVQKVPGKAEFSMMREWDGAYDWQAMVGGAKAAVTVGQNASPAEALVLGGARFNEWQLFAENGVVVTEAARFTYGTKQVVASAPGNTAPAGPTASSGGTATVFGH